MINSKGDIYIDLVKYIREGASIKTFSEYIKNLDHKNKKIVLLRHDVDVSIDRAIEFAKFEYEHEIHSTYFLLHSAKYFDYSEAFAQKCKDIIRYGHDIGLHNNILTVYFKVNKVKKKKKKRKKIESIDKIIRRPLEFLRTNGIKVIGTSCHGHKHCYLPNGYYNYEVWEEFDPKKNEKRSERKIDKVSLKTYGLLYETYFIPYDYYLSDSGGKWGGKIIVKGQPKPFERTLISNKLKDNIGLKVLEKFKISSEGVIQILIHHE